MYIPEAVIKRSVEKLYATNDKFTMAEFTKSLKGNDLEFLDFDEEKAKLCLKFLEKKRKKQVVCGSLD